MTATTFLECVTSNIPCFIFAEYEKNLISKECQYDFENLKKVGVLQNNPYKFSKFINKNLNNIDLWWSSREVKSAISQFREKYCSVEKRPIFKLSKILSQNLKLKRNFI